MGYGITIKEIEINSQMIPIRLNNLFLNLINFPLLDHFRFLKVNHEFTFVNGFKTITNAKYNKLPIHMDNPKKIKITFPFKI